MIPKVLQCLSIFNDALSGDARAIAQILCHQWDTELKVIVFHRLFDRPPETEGDLDHPQVSFGLERLKHVVSTPLMRALEEAAEREALAKDAERLARHKAMNEPHELGTVAEIAAKLGISKSEVRRHKANGTLNTLFDAKVGSVEAAGRS